MTDILDTREIIPEQNDSWKALEKRTDLWPCEREYWFSNETNEQTKP